MSVEQAKMCQCRPLQQAVLATLQTGILGYDRLAIIKLNG